jgi:Alpha/beta hydrolase domain
MHPRTGGMELSHAKAENKMRRGIKAIAMMSVIAGAAGCSNSHDSNSQDTSGRVATVDAAVLEGPIMTGTITLPQDFRAFDIATVGYLQEEWFAKGIATAYASTGSTDLDGRWDIQPASTAEYRTRMIVRRPSNPSDWSGTVVVEWLNVSGPFEILAAWSYTWPALVDAGAVYVALTAQAFGVEGGDSLLGDEGEVSGLRQSNPERYGSLVHPGDSFAFDIVSQVSSALKSEAAAAVLGGSPAERIVLSGEGQSAGFLVTYINAVQSAANSIDGFFVHKRGGSAANLDGSLNIDDALNPTRNGIRIRDDLDIPILIFETETDITVQRYATARQADTDLIRTWEVAGAAHADAYFVGGSFDACGRPINDGPHNYVARAGMAAIIRWVEQNEAPPVGERIETAGDGEQTVINRDDRGIALGGIRTPSVNVPISTLTGEAPPGGPSFCRLFGASYPFDNATLLSLYGTRANYLALFDDSLKEAVAAGFLRPEDAGEYRKEAEQAHFPE